MRIKADEMYKQLQQIDKMIDDANLSGIAQRLREVGTKLYDHIDTIVNTIDDEQIEELDGIVKDMDLLAIKLSNIGESNPFATAYNQALAGEF